MSKMSTQHTPGRSMPCRKCSPSGGAVFSGDRIDGWTCRNCGHHISDSKSELLAILREYADSPKDNALTVVTKMDGEIRRLRSAIAKATGSDA